MLRPPDAERSASRVRYWIASAALALAIISHSLASADNHDLVYQVEPGDTLTSIAGAAGVSVDDLVTLHGLADPDSLLVGQTLVLREPPPPTPEPSPTPAAPAAVGPIYRVQPGDTLYSIARRHGVSVGRLVELNNLVDPDVLVAGLDLMLPVGAQAAVVGAQPAAVAGVAATPSPQPTQTRTA